MQRGDIRRVRVVGRSTWCLRLVKKAKHGAWLVEWTTGPLAGREARVLAEYMER